jgi:tetratricopeptide (TPR) repeat protein
VYSQPQAGLLWPVLLVILVATVIYLNGIPGDFVFDDKLIVRDPRIHGQESFWRIFITDYWYKYFGTSADLYRPLTIASYALNFMVAGLSSPAFHVVNILLHAAVSAVVLILIDALLRDRPLAIVSGLLFAAHPIHTEAVTGIVGRAEILTALFLLLALYLHARRYTLRGLGPAVWMPLAGLAYFCALLSKETAIVGPGLLLLVDGVDRVRDAWREPTSDARRRAFYARDVRQTVSAFAMYIGVAVLFVWVRYLVVGTMLQRPPAKSYYLLFGHPLATRLLTGFKILAIYLKLLFFPLTLSADYSYRQVTLSQSLDSAAPLVGMVAAVCLVALFVWALRARVPALLFALGFFAVAYSVVSNLIVPIGVLVAERLMYLPSVGFCAALAWAGVTLARRVAPATAGGWLRHVPVGVLAVVLALYSARTFTRNFDWRNHETLYKATTEASPECHAAHFNYAAILLEQHRSDPAAMDLALQHLLKAYEIRQDHFPSLVNMTIIYMERGDLEKAREIALQGLKVAPNSKKMKGLLNSIDVQLRQRQKR